MSRDMAGRGCRRGATIFVHHTQRISLAAVTGDAEGIQRQINYTKQREIGQDADAAQA